MTSFNSIYSTTTASRKRKIITTENGCREKKRARLCEDDFKPETTIHSLPNEVLWEIFTCLDRESLLNANLVNKNWNQIIVGTTLMEKIDSLYITAKKVENCIPDLTRKYRSVRFDDIVEWSPELMEQISVIGEDIENVSFIECVFFYNDLFNLLQVFPNAKFMEISCCYEGIVPFPPASSQFKRIEMKALKTLVLRGYSWPLSFFSTPHLKRFEVETMGLNDQSQLMLFLNEQQELQTLRLEDIHDLFDSRCGTIQPKFKLKSLAMVNLPLLDSAQMIRFLKYMRDSVNFLDLGLELNVSVCEFILLNFENVFNMKIDYECLPKARSFYQKMKVNKNLKYLGLFGNMRSCKPLIYYLKRNTQIEELMLSDLHGLHPYTVEFWKQFSTLVPNLHTLSLHRINARNMAFIKLKHLQHLDVDYIGSATNSNWIQFCKNNPSIESFHIFMKVHEYFVGIKNIITNSLKKLKDFVLSS